MGEIVWESVKARTETSLPVKKFLYHHLIAAFAKDFILHDRVDRLFGLCQISGDHHPFAQSQPIGLDDRRELIFPLNIRNHFRRIVEYFVFRGGDPVFLHQIFGENLAAPRSGPLFCWVQKRGSPPLPSRRPFPAPADHPG